MMALLQYYVTVLSRQKQALSVNYNNDNLYSLKILQLVRDNLTRQINSAYYRDILPQFLSYHKSSSSSIMSCQCQESRLLGKASPCYIDCLKLLQGGSVEGKGLEYIFVKKRTKHQLLQATDPVQWLIKILVVTVFELGTFWFQIELLTNPPTRPPFAQQTF